MVVVCPAAGASPRQSSSAGVERSEASSVPEPEHAGGDDARVRGAPTRRRPPRRGVAPPLMTWRLCACVRQDEEAEGGDGGRGQGTGRKQPLPGKVTRLPLPDAFALASLSIALGAVLPLSLAAPLRGPTEPAGRDEAFSKRAPSKALLCG